jgi:eukaryotic-like serine/threonine-protein kinase
MQLWNDYEGKTIADKYPLGPLVRPEGRSALFQVSAGAEAPAVIRLTEAINDEGQMMACWSRVAAVKQDNLVAIKRFGETNFEGIQLTYAVMEPSDANLADLLKQRPLTCQEATQVATSVVAALSALHAKSLVHEHIDATAILAVGETVKLRADCVRECVVEPGFTTMEDCMRVMQGDVYDLAVVLLRALTLEKRLTPSTKLPAPFDRIIPNAMNGAWGLQEIAEALAPTPVPAKPVVPQPAATVAAPSAVPAKEEAGPDTPLLYRRRNDVGTLEINRTRPLWVALAIAAVIAVALFLRAGISKPASQPQAAATPAVAPVRPAIATPAPVRTPTPIPAQAAQPTRAAGLVSRMQAGWYVVAYTFNRQQQAISRAAAIAQKNPSLHPEVIAPGGHAPFLVALGGPMTRPDAENTRSRARQAGLPRDTFVQNYKGN